LHVLSIHSTCICNIWYIALSQGDHEGDLSAAAYTWQLGHCPW